MKRILSMLRAFWRFLGRDPGIERQRRLADEIASIYPKPLKKRDRREK